MGAVGKGQAPYGFRWKHGSLELETAETDIRRLAFELFVELKSKGAVARRLNELGHPTRRGSRWSDMQIGRILTCSSAVGHYIANRTRTEGGERIETDEADRVAVACEQIVPRKLWDEVAALLDEHSEKAPGPEPGHTFSGLVYCACGEKMRVPSNTPKYVCPACHKKIPITDLEAVFLDELSEFIGQRKDFLSALMSDPKRLELSQSVSEAEADLQSAKSERSKVEQLFLKGAITAERFEQLHQPLDRRVEERAAKLSPLRKKLAHLGPEPPQDDRPDLTRTSIAGAWKRLSPKKRRAIAGAFVDRVAIGAGAIEISFRFGDASPKDVASAQQISAPTKNVPLPTTTGAPVYVRLPKTGDRCPHSGLSRAKLNELILPNERNNFNPPVASKCLRKHGSTRGVRLILLESLMAYLANKQ